MADFKFIKGGGNQTPGRLNTKKMRDEDIRTLKRYFDRGICVVSQSSDWGVDAALLTYKIKPMPEINYGEIYSFVKLYFNGKQLPADGVGQDVYDAFQIAASCGLVEMVAAEIVPLVKTEASEKTNENFSLIEQDKPVKSATVTSISTGYSKLPERNLLSYGEKWNDVHFNLFKSPVIMFIGKKSFKGKHGIKAKDHIEIVVALGEKKLRVSFDIYDVKVSSEGTEFRGLLQVLNGNSIKLSPLMTINFMKTRLSSHYIAE